MTEQDPTSQFVGLLVRHQHEIFRYVLALVPNVNDAQDVMQETATALWQRFDRYDTDKPFTPWACRFALNKIREHRRRNRRWRHHLSDEVFDLIAAERSEQTSALELRRAALGQCLKKLAEEDRSLIEQKYYST